MYLPPPFLSGKPLVRSVKPPDIEIDLPTKLPSVGLDSTTQIVAIAAAAFSLLKLLLDSERKRVDRLIEGSERRNAEIARNLNDVQEKQLEIIKQLLESRK